jgi:lipopolysaccharide/colanic/teichoic acid biosynthesis glycosyltransferase
VALAGESLVENHLGDTLILAWRIFIKRGVDILFSGVLLVFGFPLFILFACLIKLTSSGSVFFMQDRVGHKGKTFRIWKFRTMYQENSVEDHQQYIRYLLREGSESESRVDLLTKYIDHVESRITPVGRFLRATSLDELPQLINIFKGDMTLVGPRPHPVYEVEEYKEWYRRRLSVKPGLTGWSKLNLRCTPKNYEESILYDLWYVDHWSLSLDLKILLMTIPFVIGMKDAR